MEKNDFENFEKLFFENFLKIFRPKNIFWGKSENHPKIENRKSNFRFSILGWFSKFPQKIFFRRTFFKKFSKKSFSKFSKSIFSMIKKYFSSNFFLEERYDLVLLILRFLCPSVQKCGFRVGLSEKTPDFCTNPRLYNRGFIYGWLLLWSLACKKRTIWQIHGFLDFSGAISDKVGVRAVKPL